MGFCHIEVGSSVEGLTERLDMRRNGFRAELEIIVKVLSHAVQVYVGHDKNLSSK